MGIAGTIAPTVAGTMPRQPLSKPLVAGGSRRRRRRVSDHAANPSRRAWVKAMQVKPMQNE
jgi:hypothetical protein